MSKIYIDSVVGDKILEYTYELYSEVGPCHNPEDIIITPRAEKLIDNIYELGKLIELPDKLTLLYETLESICHTHTKHNIYMMFKEISKAKDAGHGVVIAVKWCTVIHNDSKVKTEEEDNEKPYTHRTNVILIQYAMILSDCIDKIAAARDITPDIIAAFKQLSNLADTIPEEDKQSKYYKKAVADYKKLGDLGKYAKTLQFAIKVVSTPVNTRDSMDSAIALAPLIYNDIK